MPAGYLSFGAFVGGGGDDGVGDDRWCVACLQGVGKPGVDDLALLGVDRKWCVGGCEIRVEGGLGEPGLDQQDADSVLAHLVVDRLGVALEGVLARRVQRHVGDGNETDNRADVDDPSAVLLAHMRQYGAGHADRAEEVGLKQRAGLLYGALLGSAGDTETGVVDQHVDAAGAVEHLAYRGGHRLVVGDVEWQEHHVPALLARGRSAARPVHGEPSADEGACGGLPDPRRCSRHERYSVCLGCHDPLLASIELRA